MSSAVPALAISKWKHSVLGMVYPDALYKYKEGPTPTTFLDGRGALVFRISYDDNTQTPLLQRSPDPGQPNPEADEILFKDTMKHFKYASTKAEICGWSLGNGTAYSGWTRLRTAMLESVQEKLGISRRYRDKFNARAHVFGRDRMWVIRGYFIGRREDFAPPYVTVLCSDEDMSKFLVDAIHEKIHLHPGWGATRLPKVELRDYGSCPDDSDNSDDPFTPDDLFDFDAYVAEIDELERERELETIEVRLADNHSTPMMTNSNIPSWEHQRHRCGIRLVVKREADVITEATIGGLVKIGNRLYGLTVAHSFFRVDAAPTGESANTGNDDTDVIMQQRSRTSSMEFDWALVGIPGLQELAQDPDSWDDVNLVQTVSGDFRPVLISIDEPDLGIQVALATPGSLYCLRGIFIGSEAIVKIPGSPTPYTAWVLRMERPWLIRPGDSGSWAFNAFTGNLLGVLIAGCPELQEAYILPAHQIIDHMQTQLHLPVSLPNGYFTEKEGMESMFTFTRRHRDLKQEVDHFNFGSWQQFRNLENKVAAWNARPQKSLSGWRRIFQPGFPVKGKSISVLGPDDEGILIAVVVLNQDKSLLSVVVPPPCYGPKQWRRGSLRKDCQVFSSFRLPYMLGTKRLGEAENMKRLLTTRFKLELADFDQLQRLDLDPDHASFYSIELKRRIDVVVYEAVLPDDRLPQRLEGPTNWCLEQVTLSEAKRVLTPPFATAVEKSSAIEYAGSRGLDEIEEVV